MKFRVNTVYNRETLITFNNFFARTKIWLFIIMVIATVLVTGTFITSIALGFCDLTFIVFFALMLLYDVATVLIYFIFPRISVKKAPALNAVVHFEFGDATYTVSAKNDRIDETSTSAYSTITKAAETKDFIYLFIAKTHAFIIDKNGFTEGTPDGLIDFLVSKGVKYKK